jgi:hypothetical protein
VPDGDKVEVIFFSPVRHSLTYAYAHANWIPGHNGALAARRGIGTDRARTFRFFQAAGFAVQAANFEFDSTAILDVMSRFQSGTA